MPWICTKRERTQYIWTTLMILTAVACIILLYLSLEFTGNYCQRAGKCSGKLMKEPAQLTAGKCISSCSTEQCVRLANILHNNMDRFVDPCINFYSLSCGKFSEKFGKDDNATVFENSAKEFATDLKDLLDHLDADPETPSGKMKITYDSCMDIGASELQAVPTALEFLTKIGIPNWPHLNPDFKFTLPSLSTVLGISNVYQEFSFLSFTNYVVDGKPVFNATVECSESLLTSPKYRTPMEYFFDRILKYFGIEGEKNSEAIERLRMFRNLVNCNPNEDICEKYNATEIFLDCSQEEESEWKMLCEMIDTFVDVANISNKMSKDYVVIPCSISVFTKKFFKEIVSIPDRAIADFLAISFFMDHLDDLSFYFRLTKQKDPNAHDVIEEIDLPINRWEHCVEWIVRNMDVALAHEYILRHLSKESLLEVQDIVKECFEEARDLIHHQKWITEEEKVNITNELNVTTSVDFQIKKYLNETFVNGFYRQFHPTRESFLKNILELQTIYFVSHQVEKREHPYFSDMKPFAVNAYARSNLIEIGMGFLRFPFYFSGGTRSLNTVILDATIAHEIGHVLTRVLDSYEVNETSTREFYDHRRLCLKNQFSNFTIESLGVNVDVEMTEDEFLADNFATILVDMFMKRYFADEGAFTLPSLSYPTKQLLYIILAQYFCGKNSKEMEKLYHDLDTHPPAKYRVIATMQNSKSFSEIFSCPEESYMNPSSKCLLVDEKTE